MATLTIKQSVGKKGINQYEDSLAVQQALNRHISRGQLMGHPPVSEDGRGGSEGTIAAITAFQSEVVGMIKPDGRIDPPTKGKPGKTLQFLRRQPEKVFDEDQMLDILADNLNEPFGGVNTHVWDYAMNSLLEHFDNRRLQKHHIVMIVDYTIPMNRRRLWVFDLAKREVLIHTYVLHGWKSGGKMIDNETAARISFGNSDDRSSVGAYATGKRLKTPAGKPWLYEFYPEGQQPPGKWGDAVYLHGLDPTNDRAYQREVIIHGGYAFDEAGVAEKFSAGCIVTNPIDNDRICDWMHDGAFVFVFGGVKFMHNAETYVSA